MKGYFGKRLLALLLSLVLLLSVVACDKSDGEKKDDESATKEVATKDGEVEKPKEIKVFLDTILKKEQGQPQLAEEFEKQTGIKLTIQQPAHNQYYDIMNVTFASGDIPDVVEISEQNYLKYATEGALKDISDLVEASEPLKGVKSQYMDAVKIDGKMYGVPLHTGGGCVTYMREDWLKKVGKEVPTNYEELLDVMKAFKDNDPDGNGKADTIPYTAVLAAENKLQEQYMRDFYWHASPDFKLVDGKWIDGFQQENWKEALTRANKAYSEGLLDKEIFTNKTSTCRDKLGASKVGIFSYWNNYWSFRLEDKIQTTSAKEGKLVPLPAIEESTYLNRAPVVTAITSKCKNVPGVFENFVEYMHDGDKGQILFSFGVEGVHWDKDGDKYKMLPKLEKPELDFDKAWFSADNTVTEFKNGPLVPLDPRVTKTLEAFNKKSEQMSIFPVSKTYTKKAPEIDKARVELTSKAIIGTITVDEAIEQYKKRAAELQVETILSDFNSK